MEHEVASDTSKPPQTPVRRTRVACKACNARRVKCDAVEGQKCWRCRLHNVPCELIDSKRGKYARNKLRSDQAARTPRASRSSETRSNNASRSANSIPDNNRIDYQESAKTASLGSGNSSYVPSPANGDQPSYTVKVTHRTESGSAQPVQVSYAIPPSVLKFTVPGHDVDAAREFPSVTESLIMPDSSIADTLVYLYFDVLHPAFPVFDRANFAKLYAQGQASPLVLQAMFMLGFTVCKEDLILKAGYADRVSARRAHYRKAKALYDADYDKEPLNVVAALLLMSFWWAGYEEQKDFCHWVIASITYAQSLGLHRKSTDPKLDPRIASLRKRIWWSLFIRDRHTSAAFGRPCHTRPEDCDVEPMSTEDLAFDIDYDNRILPAQRNYHISYFLAMSKLSPIMGDILIAEHSPNRPDDERYATHTLQASLTEWEEHLPQNMRIASLDGSLGAPFWASMLHFNYQYSRVVLFRPKAVNTGSSQEAERDSKARAAADAITRNAEDQLSCGSIGSSQIHILPALFAALAIHTIVICRTDNILSQMAENKSRQCLIALGELSQIWPVSIWISKAFHSLMRRLTKPQSTNIGGAIIDVSCHINSSPMPATATGARSNQAVVPSLSQNPRDENGGWAQPPTFSSQPDYYATDYADQYWSSTLGVPELDNLLDLEPLFSPQLG